jgi:hypothetical protein
MGVCILGAAPFAAMGFTAYHGMTAEQFAWAWIKSEILMPKHLTFKTMNIYYEAIFGNKKTCRGKPRGQGEHVFGLLRTSELP